MKFSFNYLHLYQNLLFVKIELLSYYNYHIFFSEKKLKIVLFKSLRKSKRRNEGNFTLKSNWNKIMLCGVGGQFF